MSVIAFTSNVLSSLSDVLFRSPAWRSETGALGFLFHVSFVSVCVCASPEVWIAAYGSENVPLSIYNVPAWFSFVLVDIMVLQR